MSDTSSKPLTDEKLAAIRARLHSMIVVPPGDAGAYVLYDHLAERSRDVATLLAEVERLRAREAAMRAREAAMREIVNTVANAGATTYRDREDEYCTQDANCGWRSPGRGKPFQMVHTDRCIVTKARTLLATGEE